LALQSNIIYAYRYTLNVPLVFFDEVFVPKGLGGSEMDLFRVLLG